MKNNFYKAMLVMSAVSFSVSLCAIIMCAHVFFAPTKSEPVCKADMPFSIPGANDPANKVLFLNDGNERDDLCKQNEQQENKEDVTASRSAEEAEAASKNISPELIVFFDEESEKLIVADSECNELDSYPLSASRLGSNDIDALKYGLTIEKTELTNLLEDLLY